MAGFVPNTAFPERHPESAKKRQIFEFFSGLEFSSPEQNLCPPTREQCIQLGGWS